MRRPISLIAGLVAVFGPTTSVAATTGAEQFAEGSFRAWAFPSYGDLHAVACDVEPETLIATCYGIRPEGELLAAQSAGDGTVYVEWTALQGRPTDAFVMDGHSMDSTVHDGDELRVQPPTTTIERGNVVLVHHDDGVTDRYLVKRVVVLAGETIEMRDCVVSIDGEVLDEPYLDPEVVTPGNCGGDYGPTAVPENHVFVMGDNRAGSQDSRSESVGPIEVDDIAGVVDAVRAVGGDWRPIDG